MNITPIQSYNNYNNWYSKNNNQQIAFNGNLPNSRFFKPFNKRYAKLIISLRDNYHKKIINSKFMSWFLDKTENVNQMTTHMMVAGSTLISGMYVVRTLQNDKLDKQKRKTLALNDLLTWTVSTICAYALDKSLNKKWEGLTRRFAAGYIKKYTDPEYIKQFEAEQESIKAHCLAKKLEYKAPKFNPKELAEKCKANGITAENLNKNIQDAVDNITFENYKIKVQNEAIKARNKKLPVGAVPEKLIDKLSSFKTVKDFNVEVLKFEPLTSKLAGMSALKSIFIFSMVYRYLVPVLVMKPANKLGAYLHQKKEEKEQQTAAK